MSDFKKYDITFTKRERYIAQINVLKMSKANKYKILNGTIFQLYSRYIITIRALAKSKIITYVRGKLKNLHDEIKCFSIIDFNCFSNPFRNFFLFHDNNP